MNNDELRRDDGDGLPDDVAWDAFDSPDAFEAIEEAIRAAGTYVAPSDDLRPKTLEAAQQRCEDRRGGMRIGGFAAVLLVCIVASAPLAERLTAWHERTAAPSSSELQEQALEIATDRNVGPHWGLLEAFSELRRSQAARLRPTTVHGAMQ